MIQTSNLLKIAVDRNGTLFYADNNTLYCSSNGTDIDYSYKYSTNNYEINILIAYERYVFIFNKQSSTYVRITIFDTETKTHTSFLESGYISTYMIIDQYIIVKYYYDSTTNYFYAYDLMTLKRTYLGINLTIDGLMSIANSQKHHVVYEKLDNVTYYYYTLSLSSSTASALTFKITKYLFSMLDKKLTEVSVKTHTVTVSQNAGVCTYDLYTPDKFVVNSQYAGAFVCNTSSSVAEYSLNTQFSYVKTAITAQNELVTLFYDGGYTCLLYKDQTLLKTFNIGSAYFYSSFQKITNYISCSSYDNTSKSFYVDRIKVGIPKQKGSSLHSLEENVFNGGINDLILAEVITAVDSAQTNLNECVQEHASQTFDVVETVNIEDSATLVIKEEIPKSGINDLMLSESIEKQPHDYTTTVTTLEYNVTQIDREEDIVVALCTDKSVRISSDNGKIFRSLKIYDEYWNVCVATNGSIASVGYYSLSDKKNKIDIWDVKNDTLLKTFDKHSAFDKLMCTQNYIIGYDSETLYIYNYLNGDYEEITCSDVKEIKEVDKKLIVYSFVSSSGANNQYITYSVSKRQFDFITRELVFLSERSKTINVGIAGTSSVYVSEDFVAVVSTTICVYSLATGEKVKEFNETPFDKAFTIFYRDNQNDLIYCFDSIEGDKKYVKLCEEDTQVFADQYTSFVFIAAMDSVSKTYLSLAYENKIVTIRMGLQSYVANKSLGLLEVVSEIDRPIVPVVETVQSINIEFTKIKETVTVGGKAIEISEEIRGGMIQYKKISLNETIRLPNVHLRYLSLHENAIFKQGEFGSESIEFPIKEIIEDKPHFLLPLKEGLVDKPPVQIVLSSVDGCFYEDEFCGRANPMVITTQKDINQSFSLSGPGYLYENIADGWSDYTSYAYDLTATIPASTKKRYLLIPKTVKSSIKVGTFSYGSYTVSKVNGFISGSYITQADFEIYNQKTGVYLECENIPSYEDYLCYRLPREPQTICIKLQYGNIVHFQADSFKIATFKQNDDFLTLSEYAFAYSNNLNVKEAISSNQFFYYQTDNILQEHILVPPADNYIPYYKTNRTLQEKTTLLFEVETSRNFSCDYITFRKDEMIKNVKRAPLEYYTIRNNYYNTTKQVYGFTVEAPFSTNLFCPLNMGNDFIIRQIYDCHNTLFSINNQNLVFNETIQTQYVKLPIQEEVVVGIEGYHMKQIAETILDEKYTISQKNLPTKEYIAGSSGQSTLNNLKENILDAEGHLFSELYRSTLRKPLELERLPIMQNYQCKSNEMYFVKTSDTAINWGEETFINIDFTKAIYLWNHISFLIGLTDNEGKLFKIEVLLSTTLDKEMQINITRFIQTYLIRNNIPLITNRIKYIGFKNDSDYVSFEICDFSVRLTQISSGNLAIKENAIANVNRVEYPEIFYKMSNYKSYRLNQVIPDLKRNDAVYFAIPLNIPKRLVIETNTEIIGLKGSYNRVDEKYIVTEPVIKDGKYYYDIEIVANNTAQYIFITFEATAMQPANPIFYKVELYHKGYKDSDVLNFTEKIHDFIPYKSVGIYEYVGSKPFKAFEIKENVLNIKGDARILSLREKIAPTNSYIDANLLSVKEIIDLQLSNNHLLLQECIPTEPQKDNAPIYEYVLEDTHEELLLREKVVNPKVGIDGKVMVEIIK